MKNDFLKIAESLVTKKRGILAADESFGTIKKRFETIGLESTAENRRKYRQLLFTASGIEKYISGVIMFDETIRQKTNDGTLFPKYLLEKGIVPGIKVDEGKFEIPNFSGEYLTVGLKNLRERLVEYKNLGAKFTKWRAIVPINKGFVSRAIVNTNMQNLAIYAVLVQEQGMVPIVEPEVLMEGAHDIKECAEATQFVLESLFEKLFKFKAAIEGIVLKVNMIVPGKDNKTKATPKEVADYTLRVLQKAVPDLVPSVVFLSGGLSPVNSTRYLNAINKRGVYPWKLNFSFGRALQEPVLKAWGGKDENINMAQKEFLKRARLNSLALQGKYDVYMEDD